jgi:hypothetical protein
MSKLQVIVPESLGLTEEQIEDLTARFSNQLVEVLRSPQVETQRVYAYQQSKKDVKVKVHTEKISQ